MANRSTNIKGRVLRNLKRYKIENSDTLDDEIYDEMNQCQNHIISDSQPETKITITLKTGIDTYPLTTNVIDPLAPTVYRKNICSISMAKLPEGIASFEMLNNMDFIDVINQNPVASELSFMVASIRDNDLVVYPVPSADLDGLTMDLIVNKRGPNSLISKDVVPETVPDYDKAYEFYCTAQFLIGNDRIEWDIKFEKELKRLRPLEHRKPISRKAFF